MSHFNQYNETPIVRTDKQVMTQQETDQMGNQKVTQATQLDPVNDGVRAYDDDYQYAVISTATTTTIKTEAGFIKEIRVIGGTLGNVTVYDNTAASGTLIVPTVSPDKGQVLKGPCKFATGLTIVTAAATLLAISYR